MIIPHSAFRIPKYEGMIAFAQEALGLSASASIEISSFEGRGSDRSFFRMKWNSKDSAILIHYDLKRKENTYYAEIAVFLQDIGVPVPRLIRHDPAGCLILMEDVGNEDLWSLRKASWEIRRTLYQKTLTAVHKLHCFPEKDFPACHVRLMEGFGPDLYRWERNYFMDHFVRGVCGIAPGPVFKEEIEAELSSLAERLLRAGQCLVHRDLQSQNVMIRNGEPFLIDFQGMRFGSLFYDLGSLLYDPYMNFPDSERDALLNFYYRLSKWDFDWTAFRNCFWEASAQRLMQALGAYGFLGFKKGMKAYLDHIPSGLHNLCCVTSRVASLPRLLDLTQTCRRIIDQRGYEGEL